MTHETQGAFMAEMQTCVLEADNIAETFYKVVLSSVLRLQYMLCC